MTRDILSRPLVYIQLDDFVRKHQAEDINMNPENYSIPDLVYRTQDDKFGVSGFPDEDYRVEFDYWTDFTRLSSDSSTSSIPERFEQIIVDGIMFYCYMFRDNLEMQGIWGKRFEKGIRRMRTQLINSVDYFTTSNPRGAFQALRYHR